jgi:hypothetical protein
VRRVVASGVERGKTRDQGGGLPAGRKGVGRGATDSRRRPFLAAI